MEITIKHNVDRCRDCPYSSNTSQEHNCSFTSEPYPTIWFCNHKGYPDYRQRIIRDEYKIDKDCPFTTSFN